MVSQCPTLADLANQYCSIRQKTGRGYFEIKEDGSITDDRTDEQCRIANQVVTSLARGLRGAAYSFLRANAYTVPGAKFRFSLYGVRPSCTIDIDDLIQEGAIGVMYSLTKYEPGRGHDGQSSVLTFSLIQAAAHMQKYILRNTPSRDTRRSASGKPREVYHQVDIADLDVLSLENPAGIKTPPDPEQARRTKELCRHVRASIAEMGDPRMQDILARRHGLHKGSLDEPLTLQSIADEYQVSKERIRQLEAAGTKRFKNAISHRIRNVSENLL